MGRGQGAQRRLAGAVSALEWCVGVRLQALWPQDARDSGEQGLTEEEAPQGDEYAAGFDRMAREWLVKHGKAD